MLTFSRKKSVCACSDSCAQEEKQKQGESEGLLSIPDLPVVYLLACLAISRSVFLRKERVRVFFFLPRIDA